MRANGEAAHSPVHWNTGTEPRHCRNSRKPDYQHAAIKYVVNRTYGRSRPPWIQENSTDPFNSEVFMRTADDLVKAEFLLQRNQCPSNVRI